jgi:hypothetical protein
LLKPKNTNSNIELEIIRETDQLWKPKATNSSIKLESILEAESIVEGNFDSNDQNNNN